MIYLALLLALLALSFVPVVAVFVVPYLMALRWADRADARDRAARNTVSH